MRNAGNARVHFFAIMPARISKEIYRNITNMPPMYPISSIIIA